MSTIDMCCMINKLTTSVYVEQQQERVICPFIQRQPPHQHSFSAASLGRSQGIVSENGSRYVGKMEYASLSRSTQKASSHKATSRIQERRIHWHWRAANPCPLRVNHIPPLARFPCLSVWKR